MPRRSRISDFEWKLLLGVVATIDLAQIVMDIFIVGELINRLDFIIGGALALYLKLRGFGFDWSTWKWLAGSIIVEEIPLADAAPAWSIDVWRFWKMDQERGRAVLESEQS